MSYARASWACVFRAGSDWSFIGPNTTVRAIRSAHRPVCVVTASRRAATEIGAVGGIRGPRFGPFRTNVRAGRRRGRRSLRRISLTAVRAPHAAQGPHARVRGAIRDGPARPGAARLTFQVSTAARDSAVPGPSSVATATDIRRFRPVPNRPIRRRQNAWRPRTQVPPRSTGPSGTGTHAGPGRRAGRTPGAPHAQTPPPADRTQWHGRSRPPGTAQWRAPEPLRQTAGARAAPAM
jgi:hypothetical protein